MHLGSLLGAALTLASVPALAEEPVRVLAAGSLSAAFGELAKNYRALSGTTVETAFGSSGLLFDRIEKGERADLFASANLDHPQALAREGKTAGPAVIFTRNALCGIARSDVGLTTGNFLDRILDPATKLATSTPKADPAGDYAWALFAKAETVKKGAKAALEGKALQLVGGPNSPPVPAGQNAVAYFLQDKRADVFLVYCSSAGALGPGYDTVATPPAIGVSADYGLVVPKSTPDREDAAFRFAFYILSEDGQAVLARYGLKPVTASAAK